MALKRGIRRDNKHWLLFLPTCLCPLYLLEDLAPDPGRSATGLSISASVADGCPLGLWIPTGPFWVALGLADASRSFRTEQAGSPHPVLADLGGREGAIINAPA